MIAADPLARYVSEMVVIDTDAEMICIGTLAEVTPASLHLTDADLHSMRDTNVTREVYIMETAKLGVRAMLAGTLAAFMTACVAGVRI